MSETQNSLEPLLITVHELSKIISVPVGTINNWRVAGIGLPFIKLGAGKKAPVRYAVADVHEYVAKQRRYPSVRNEMEAPLGVRKKR
jgi:hypothetical protein